MITTGLMESGKPDSYIINVELHPSGAVEHAAFFRIIAERLCILIEEYRAVKSRLSQTWQGRTHDRFNEQCSRLMSRLEVLVEQSKANANEIDSKQVTTRRVKSIEFDEIP